MAIPVHRSTERSPGDRGRAFGRAQADAVATTLRVYRRLLGEVGDIGPAELRIHGEAVGSRVATVWPDLVDEIHGVAAAVGEPAEDLLAVNARTELLAGATPGECSLLARLEPGDDVWLAQNWDWHPDLLPARVVHVVETDDGWCASATEAGIVGKIGLNSHGVACGLNFLATSLDTRDGGLPVHMLMRAVVDRCASATEALGLLLNAQTSASACLTLAAHEAEGATLASVELSPAGASVAWPDADGTLVHTNHFLAGPPDGRDVTPAEYPSTLLREFRLRRTARSSSREAALRSHYPQPHPVCRHASLSDPWPEQRATLFSIVLDPVLRTMDITDGPPCEANYVRVVG